MTISYKSYCYMRVCPITALWRSTQIVSYYLHTSLLKSRVIRDLRL